MEGYVYILESDDNRFYIGSTNDLERRVYQHNHRHTHTTMRMKKLVLVFSQKFDTLEKARIIERKIKSWKRKDFIKKIIADGFITSLGD